MGEILCSVGLDVGTTTTQMIVSRLTVENRATGFAVPQLEISDRQILYRSPVHFTPLYSQKLVDGEKLRQMVEQEYKNAGITREDVDTGAIIITGETSRKENARTVLEALSHLAGRFVVATAGPDLESVLAARGAGALEHSQKTGKRVLHMDIGGGTSNLCLMEGGRILQTGCLNVGGRLLKLDGQGTVVYASPVLPEIKEGDRPSQETLKKLTEEMAAVLEMAAGLRPQNALWEKYRTQEVTAPWNTPEGEVVLSFSGGVAACMAQDYPELAFGDIGPLLGRAIRNSRLCAGPYILAQEAIRATVIGAGCYSTTLSGSTVFYRHISFPLKNIPVISARADDIPPCPQELAVLYLQEVPPLSYEALRAMARELAAKWEGPVLVAMDRDMAKALGHLLCLFLPPDRPVLCIDSLRLSENSYLDVGGPVGPALPVVIKTLILSQ